MGDGFVCFGESVNDGGFPHIWPADNEYFEDFFSHLGMIHYNVYFCDRKLLSMMKNPQLKCVFMGSPLFSVPVLEAILDAFPESVVGVITQPDMGRGRGKKVSPTPVAEVAMARGIPVYKPESKLEIEPILSALAPDLVVVVAYGMILPKSVTEGYFCMNGHSSLLPQYRGAAPIHFALLNGDTETGITLIKITEKMDAGDVLLKQACPIDPLDTLGSLHDRLSLLCAEMVVRFIKEHFLPSDICPIAQVESEATYTRKLTTADREINRLDSAEVSLNRVRAFSPVPGAFISLDGGGIVKVLSADIVDNRLRPLRVKPEGKAEMVYPDYLLGNPPII